MAEPLKNFFDPDVTRRIGASIQGVWQPFDTRGFVRSALRNYEPLGLMQRAEQIAQALHAYLPQDYPQAIEILLRSLGPKTARTSGMAPFFYLPHVTFVARYGLDHFEESMHAQHVLTRRFTAEFSIRSFIERYPELTLERLRIWASDASADVRRLVSEGTRPRLPWAPRLRQFQEDPRPVLELLDLLKDDSSLYVRRSVANSLNDISKDHPEIVIDVVKRWQRGATPEREWIIRHALRSAIKRAEPGALTVLGFGHEIEVAVRKRRISPKLVRMGEAVEFAFHLTNAGTTTQRVLADLRVHFVKANGVARAKVFKLKTLQIEPRTTVSLRKKLSLVDLTTRKHYPGIHRVEVLLNGRARSLGAFTLLGRERATIKRRVGRTAARTLRRASR